jgi:hypothetical protein
MGVGHTLFFGYFGHAINDLFISNGRFIIFHLGNGIRF